MTNDVVGGGPCRFCGIGDENTELRFGMCFKCFSEGNNDKEKDGEKNKSKKAAQD